MTSQHSRFGWIPARSSEGDVQRLPDVFNLTVRGRFHVHVLTHARIGGLELVSQVEQESRELYVLEDRRPAMVLLRRIAEGHYRFASGFYVPSRALIESMARDALGIRCRLCPILFRDLPFMFVAGWSKDQRLALPVRGLGPGEWRPLDEHLAAIEEAAAAEGVTSTSRRSETTPKEANPRRMPKEELFRELRSDLYPKSFDVTAHFTPARVSDIPKLDEFVIPSPLRIKVIRKPGTKERQGINPFTKEPIVIPEKPGSKKLKRSQSARRKKRR
jgi:hypothetical protein